MKKAYIIIWILVNFVSCTHTRHLPQSKLVQGMLVDMRGLDGCTWGISTDPSGEKLIPLNIDDFKIQKKDGLQVEFSYTEKVVPNNCMAGKTILIGEIRPR